MIAVRYADDTVVGFQHRLDAEEFLTKLRERLRSFGLELHPDKTRLIEFGVRACQRRQARNEGKPETFDFLGFTHICGRSRAGRFLLMRRTIAKRMRARLHSITKELQARRHHPIREQGMWLRDVVRGYFAYHAVPTNVNAMGEFRVQVTRHWLRALRRRSQHDGMTWERLHLLANRWLPRARVLHPWPEKRFDARTQGKSPVR